MKEEAFLHYPGSFPEEDEELSEAEVMRIEESRKAARRREEMSHLDVKRR